MAAASLDRLALLVVDVQRAFDDADHWGRRNNPDCEANITALIEHWRSTNRAVVFVRHDSTESGSPLRPDAPGHEFKDVVTGEPDLLVSKQVNSSFHGDPDLAAWLRDRDLDGIVVTGITTNHCCETTARVGANLGFEVIFVPDATHTFDRHGPGELFLTADQLVEATTVNLHDEFARIATTRELIGAA